MIEIMLKKKCSIEVLLKANHSQRATLGQQALSSDSIFAFNRKGQRGRREREGYEQSSLATAAGVLWKGMIFNSFLVHDWLFSLVWLLFSISLGYFIPTKDFFLNIQIKSFKIYK